MALRRSKLLTTEMADIPYIAYHSSPAKIQILIRKIHTSENREIKFFQNPIRERFIYNAMINNFLMVIS